MNSIIHNILQIKGYDVWSIDPQASVFDALRVMAAKEVGALAVLEGDKLVGIISERDYARKIILEGKASKETKVGEIMTRHVITIHPSQTIYEAMELMTNHRIRHLPVVDQEEKVIGVISLGDVVREVIYVQKERIKGLENQIRDIEKQG
jgi:CBS-domain-containing membrane protein